MKNEWSRYLGLVQAGKGKTLIPAYKDMDPYDMPEEFAYLQSQDMGKLGYLQDLVRGVEKLIPKKSEEPTRESGSNTAQLVKRAFSLAEQGMAVVVLSNEAQEIIRVCDRALVMYHGSIRAEVSGETMNEQEMMRLATGG